MARSLLIASDLKVGHGAAVATEVQHLELHAGDLVCLVGPNGGGKSTLIRTLLGWLPPLAGSVTLGTGERIHALAPTERARHLAYVPQDESPSFGFPVSEAVMMGRFWGRAGWEEGEADRRATEAAMRRTGVLPLQSRPITELSGGEKQRVLLARALAQEAPIILLDEPNAHLDLHHQLDLEETLRSLVHQEQRAVVAAVHDLNMAIRLGGRCLLIQAGKPAQEGSPLEWAQSGLLRDVYGVDVEILSSAQGPVLNFVRPPSGTAV